MGLLDFARGLLGEGRVGVLGDVTIGLLILPGLLLGPAAKDGALDTGTRSAWVSVSPGEWSRMVTASKRNETKIIRTYARFIKGFAFDSEAFDMIQQEREREKMHEKAPARMSCGRRAHTPPRRCRTHIEGDEVEGGHAGEKQRGFR
jgi:hypothetical protein